MACVDCEERRRKLRDAILRGKLGEAVEQTVEGLRVMIGIDAGADHRAEAAEPEDLASGGTVPHVESSLVGADAPEAIAPKIKRRARKAG